MSRKNSVDSAHRYLTAAEVCNLLRIHRRTLRRIISRHQITYVRLAGKHLFPAGDVERFVAERMVKAA